VQKLLKLGIECAWCGKEIDFSAASFASHFKSRSVGGSNCPDGLLHLSFNGVRHPIPLLVARQGSSLKGAGTDAVAVCCSSVCQSQLESAWQDQDLAAIAHN
jgi:hypothetical protein